MSSWKEPTPIHLIAAFNTGADFLQNFVAEPPCGGVFIDLLDGTSPALLQAERYDLLGQTIELRLAIEKPRLDFRLRGVISFATPLNTGMQYRRLRVEFFPYEARQIRYLLELLKDYPGSEKTAHYHFRHEERFPIDLRLEFECDAHAGPGSIQSAGATGQGLLVRARTEELGRMGCSFQAIRFFQPGTPLRLKIFSPVATPTLRKPAWTFLSTVRWLNTRGFNRHYMGVAFDFTEDPAQREQLFTFLGGIRKSMEAHLVSPKPPT